MTARPVVFLGPTLPEAEARAILDAEIRPPARAGDVLRAALDGPPAIGLVDGIFTAVPTVRHREILWALSRGIPVFGAASMGALRAAELDGEGMVGVGAVYRWVRRRPLAPDDAVAVAHAPPELGCRPLSDALVDIRRSLRAAERAGALSPALAVRIAAEARACPFPERRLETLAERVGGPDARAAVAAHRRHRKADDARALLRRMAGHAERGDWPVPRTPPPAPVHAWLDDLAACGIDPARLPAP